MSSRNAAPASRSSADRQGIVNQLRLARLRPTANRISVVGAIERMRGRFTVEDIYRQILDSDITTSIGTIYRVLADLEAAGILRRDWVSSLGSPKAMFTIVHPAHSPEQPRLVCRSCGCNCAIADAATLELLERFLGREGPDSPARRMVIEADECANCRKPGVKGAANARLIALAQLRRKGIPGG
ncbi:MAG: transcriptional repressor [Steroidobacteraceae bacterium]